MAAWSNKKPNCVVTWGTLAVLGESTRSFPTSGDVKVRRFTYWVPDEDMRSTRARTLAVQMDNTFRNLFDTRFEDGVRKTKAIVAITGLLLEGDKTMNDLAELNDDLYRFLGEGG
ncbi:MAG: hypothetical protein GY711_03095 [bacterium]|nr:hypothetical protein [bacterium]